MMRFRQSRHWCWILSVVLTLQPVLVLQQQQLAAQEPDKPEVKEPTPEELAKMAEDMEKAFKALEAAEKEIPRDTFDPKAIIDKVGKDPVQIFEWVRDKTYWVPYRGALRGPTGVLMDRLGSSLDRSLLLAELLREAGHEVRLARAELTEEQALTLLPRLRPVPKEPLPRPAEVTKNETDALIEKYASEFGLDGAAIHNNIEKISLEGAKLSEDIAQRVADQTPLILKAIGKPDEKTVKAQRALEAAAQLQALRDHWWVQREDATAWIDLDPLLPDAEAGSGHATSEETFAPDAESGKFVLDNKFCHEVQISVVIEQWTKDGVAEKTVLSHTLRPFELFGERIALQHVPMHWPKDLDFFAEKEPLEKLKTTVLAETEWMPVLSVGADRIAEASFTDSGEINKAAFNQLVSGLEEGVKGLDPFGRFKPKQIAKPSAESKLTAEWIDYEICAPGLKSRKIRRQIFDLWGPAARVAAKVEEPTIAENTRLERGLNLLGETEMLTLACQLSATYVQNITARNLLANREVLTSLIGRVEVEMNVLTEQVSKAVPPPGNLYNLALVRQQQNWWRGDVYLDRLNILSYHSQLRLGKKNELLACSGFDIVSNNISVRSGTGTDPFLIRLEQGVRDTNAESFLTAGCGKVENTAEFFAAAGSQGIEWTTIRSVRDPAWRAMDLTDDARTRLEQDLAVGYVIMLPSKSASVDGLSLVGWWRVDPKTGETLGIGEHGWGQATFEKVAILAMALVMVSFAICLVRAINSSAEDPDRGFRDYVNCNINGICRSTAVVAGGVGSPFLAAVLVFLCREAPNL